MSAAQKTSKAELVSIYRLEFYKKQKNWKYYSQERKREEERKKAAKNAKSKLNVTYNVDPGPERDTQPTDKKEVVEEEVKDDPEVLSDERGDNLNEAFVDTGTDENATPPTQLDPPNSPYSPKWSIQHWAAQCKAHGQAPTYPSDCYPQTFPSNTYPHTNEGVYMTELTQEQNPKYADLPPFRTDLPPLRTDLPPFRTDLPPLRTDLPPLRTDLPPFRTDLPPFRTELPPFRTELPPVRTELPPCASVLGAVRAWEQVGSHEECARGWPATSQVWVNRQEQGWLEEELPDSAEAEGPDGAEWALLEGADDWLSAASENSWSLPSASSGSFARGAALAPHSTETDLLSDEGGSLSAAALSAAIARHADTLRGLLAEERRRGRGQRQASTSPVEPIYSFDEYPTRDVGPASCPYQPPVDDVIITGSFRNRPDLRGQTEVGVGRGRGRRVKLIGIGMGRPYRL